jgi:hypothetical protein
MIDGQEPSPHLDQIVYLPEVGSRHSEIRQRLAAELARTRLEVDQRKDTNSGWWSRADRLALEAEQAARHDQPEGAWGLILESRRCLIPLLPLNEKAALAQSLRAELAKLTGWRRSAMDGLLGDGKSGQPPDDANLMEALSHVDNTNTNKLRGLRLRRNELIMLLLVLLLSLGILVLLFAVGGDIDLQDVTFNNGGLLIVVLLFGIIGATLSALQRTSRRASMRVPDVRAAAVESVIRSLSGAGGALIVLAAAQAGLLGNEPGAVLLAAFAAGFSERFILRFIPEKPEDTKAESDGSTVPEVGDSPK